MTLLRNKKAEVMNKGRAKRGTYEVDASAAHYKNYQWWLNNGGTPRETESFCHYWRVVAVWVPLQKLRNRMDKPWVKRLLIVLGVLVALGLIGLVAATWTEFFIGIVGGMLFLAYIRLSGHMFALLLGKIDNDLPAKTPLWLKNAGYGLQALVTFVCLPIMLVFTVFVLVVMMVASPFDEHNIHYWFVETHPRRLWWFTPLTVTVVTALSYLVLTAWVLPVPEALSDMSRGILQVLGGGGVGVAIFIGLTFLANNSRERMKARKRGLHEARYAAFKENNRQINNALLVTLFALQNDEESAGYITYEEWGMAFAEGHGFVSFDAFCELPPWQIVEGFEDAWLDQLLDYYKVSSVASLLILLGEDQATGDIRFMSTREPPRRPLRSSFTATVDFFALFWAYLVTKKWRICPIVTLPADK